MREENEINLDRRQESSEKDGVNEYKHKEIGVVLKIKNQEVESVAHYVEESE